MPVGRVEANPESTFVIFDILSSVFGIFVVVNTDFGIGIGILKYPISVRFFGIPTQD